MTTPTISPATAESKLARAAVRLAETGYCVIPLAPRAKHPAVRDWPNIRWTPAQVQEHWRQHPDCNVGIVLGAPSRAVVLDFDTSEAWERWNAQHPEVKTLTVCRTGAPGWRRHLHFRLQPGQEPPASTRVDGIDVLSTGRCVVVPPSVHPDGSTYGALPDCPHPAQWQDAYLPRPPAQTVGTTAARGAAPEAWEALREQVARVASAEVNTRNTTLFQAACRVGEWVAGGTLPEAEAVKALTEAAMRAGLGEREARATVQSGFRHGRENPRTAPTRPPHVVVVSEQPPPPPDDWPAPAPLESSTTPPEGWPWEAMPAPLQALGQEAVRALGAPDSMVAAALLGLASGACAGRVTLEVKDGHRVSPNLYILVSAPPGAGKSPVMKALLQPFHQWEAQELPAFRQRHAAWRAWQEIIEGQRAGARRRASAVDNPDDAQEIATALAKIEGTAEEEPHPPRVLAEDGTPESIARLLYYNKETLTLVSAEGRCVASIVEGRYSENTPDVSLFLRCYSGDRYVVDRIGRQAFTLHTPLLAVVLLMQPDAAARFVTAPEVANSGLAGRFCVVLAPGGSLDYPTETIPGSLLAEYDIAIRRLLSMPRGPEAKPVVGYLPEEPMELFRTWYRETGARMMEASEDGQHVLASALSKYRELPLRLALTIAAVETAAQHLPAEPFQITRDDVGRGLDLARHLEMHMRAALSTFGQHIRESNAAAVLRWVRRHVEELRQARAEDAGAPVLALRTRDVLRAHLPGCEDSESAIGVLKDLEARGWLHPVHWQRPGQGTRPQTIWHVHPAVLAESHPQRQTRHSDTLPEVCRNVECVDKVNAPQAQAQESDA